MNDEDYKEFHEGLYYGADIELLYNKMFYHIESYVEENNGVSIRTISVEKLDKSIWSHDVHELYEELFEESSENIDELIESCLSAPLFEGKSFYELRDEIELLEL